MSLQPLEHVEASELPMSHLCIMAKVPASEGPTGALWIRKRFFMFADSEMTAADPSTAQTFGPGQNSSVAMMSKWNTANDLVESDGMAKYLALCEELGVKPIHIVSKKLLSLSRELTLRNFPLSHNAVLALAASLKDNRHIQDLTLDDVGLTPETSAELCDALSQAKQVKSLDLSNNSIGQHRAVRAASYAPDGIHGIAALILATEIQIRVLILQNVGLGDRDVLELAAAMWKNHSLVRIDLCHNNVGDRGAVQLANLVTSCENIRVLNVTWNKVTPKGVTVLQNATNVRNEVEKPARRTLMPLVDLQAEDEDVYRYNGMLEFQDADMVKRHLKMLLGLELNEKAPENRCVTILDLETDPATRNKKSQSPERDGFGMYKKMGGTRRASMHSSIESRRGSVETLGLASRRGSMESIMGSPLSRRGSTESVSPISRRGSASSTGSNSKEAEALETLQLYDPLTGRRASLIEDDGKDDTAAPPGKKKSGKASKGSSKPNKLGARKGSVSRKASVSIVSRRPSAAGMQSRRGSAESIAAPAPRGRSRSVSESRPSTAESVDSLFGSPRSVQSSGEGKGGGEQSRGARKSRVRQMTRREYLRMKQTLKEELLTLFDKLGVIRMLTHKKKLTIMQVWEMLLPFYHTSMEYAACTALFNKLPNQTDSDIVIDIQRQYANSVRPRKLTINVASHKAAAPAPAEGTASPNPIHLPDQDADSKKSSWKRARAAAVALSVLSGQQSANVLKKLSSSRILRVSKDREPGAASRSNSSEQLPSLITSAPRNLPESPPRSPKARSPPRSPKSRSTPRTPSKSPPKSPPRSPKSERAEELQEGLGSLPTKPHRAAATGKAPRLRAASDY